MDIIHQVLFYLALTVILSKKLYSLRSKMIVHVPNFDELKAH